MNTREMLASLFNDAVAAFEAGKIGESELLAIGMAVNDVLSEMPNAAPIAAINADALRARLAELDAS